MASSREVQHRADRQLLVYLTVLIVFGIVALMSASAPVGFSRFHDSYFFVKRQILFGLIPGLVIFLFLAKINYHYWERFAWLVYIAALILLALIFVPGLGLTLNGHHSWLQIAGFNLQPSEFAKLGLIVVAAYMLAGRKHNWDDWQHSLVPILALVAPALALVVAQPDVGTLSIMIVIIFMMLWMAQVPVRYLLALGSLGALGFAVLVLIAPYRADRLTTFLHPELDPQGIGYHINQAFLAVGSGGFWGLGFGHSRQKFQYLPEVDTDSIFAIVAEENGFIISVGFVILILLIGWRGLRVAKHAPDTFSYLLVGGIMVWLVWQSFLNIGAMVGALPLTGVPLPFMSHGGSSMIAILAAMGLVVNVSKTSKLV